MPRIDISKSMHYERRRSVILNITHDCNLHCKYCYESEKSSEYMSIIIAKQAIIEFMEEKNDFDKVEFQFFGGEPFLHFDLIKETVDWFHERQWNKKHLFFIGTNGTILTEQIKGFLINYSKCVWVGVSLDGSKRAHDLSRSNSYDKVISHLPFFKEHYPTQPVKMTIGKETIPYVAESIIDLEEKEILFTANVVFENIWGDFEEKSRLLNIYMSQLVTLVKYYTNRLELYPPKIISHDLSGVIIDQKLLGTTITERWCGTGKEMTMVDVDGQRYPCHRFSPWITNRLLRKETTGNRFVSWKPDNCKYCILVNICPTCAGYNWEENGDLDFRTSYHCDFFKTEILASCLYHTKIFINHGHLEQIRERFPNELKKKIIDAILFIDANGV